MNKRMAQRIAFEAAVGNSVGYSPYRIPFFPIRSMKNPPPTQGRLQWLAGGGDPAGPPITTIPSNCGWVFDPATKRYVWKCRYPASYHG